MGHRADQCHHNPNRRVNAVGYEGDGQEEDADLAAVEVGRVWRVAAVTVDSTKSKWENANSFAARAKEDEDKDGGRRLSEANEFR